MVLLMVVTVVYLPIVLPLLLPEVSVDLVGDCSLPPPADAAAACDRSCPEGALWRLGCTGEAHARLDFQPQPHLSGVLITAANIDKVLQVFGTRGILAGLLFIALGFGTGWLLGGPSAQTKRVMALGTGSAQHCRRTRGREPKLQRPEGGRYGHRSRHRRIGRSHAAFSSAGQSD